MSLRHTGTLLVGLSRDMGVVSGPQKASECAASVRDGPSNDRAIRLLQLCGDARGFSEK